MKILHLIDIPWWSGLSTYAFDCIQAHIDSGHQILLACERDSLPHKMAVKMELKILPICGRKAWFSPVNFARIGSAVLSEKPDWIVAHTGSTHWIAFFWGKLRGSRVIRTRAVSHPARMTFLNKRLYDHTDWVIVASEKLKVDYAVRMSPNSGTNLAVFVPPVSEPNGETSVGGLPVSPFKIGVLARLDPCKGHSVFLRSAKIVQEKFGDSEFHIAGPEENLKWHHLLEEVKELDLRNVFYHGFLPRNKVWEFLSSCHLGVISSLESEEVSRALLEWMSSGRPVVATRVGCIPEVLCDGKGGRIVSPGDAQEMAEKLTEILSQPALRIEMGEFNSNEVGKKFSKERFRSEWQKILASK